MGLMEEYVQRRWCIQQGEEMAIAIGYTKNELVKFDAEREALEAQLQLALRKGFSTLYGHCAKVPEVGGVSGVLEERRRCAVAKGIRREDKEMVSGAILRSSYIPCDCVQDSKGCGWNDRPGKVLTTGQVVSSSNCWSSLQVIMVPGIKGRSPKGGSQ